MGSSSSRASEERKPRVIVVGAGYAGREAASRLDSVAEVILVEKRNYAQHNVGLLRGIVEAGWAYRCAIPLDKLLKNGSVVQANVSAMTASTLTSSDGRSIDFDYLVIATGSEKRFPGGGSQGGDAVAFADHYESVRNEVESVRSVLIIGGGAVGVELAGEIKGAFPACTVTLCHKSDKLCHPELPEKFHERCRAKLRKLGVALELGEKAELPEEALSDLNWVGRNASIRLESGKSLQADLVFCAIGTRLNSEAYTSFFASAMDEHSRLRVRGTGQVEGYENIFACGDCCCTPNDDWAMGYHAGEQAKLVASNIKSMIKASAKNETPRLAPSYSASGKVAMMVTLGRNEGVGQLPFGAAPTFLVTKLKCKDLFTAPNWKAANYPVPKRNGLDSPTSPVKRRDSARAFEFGDLGSLGANEPPQLSDLGNLTPENVDTSTE